MLKDWQLPLKSPRVNANDLIRTIVDRESIEYYSKKKMCKLPSGLNCLNCIEINTKNPLNKSFKQAY